MGVQLVRRDVIKGSVAVASAMAMPAIAEAHAAALERMNFHLQEFKRAAEEHTGRTLHVSNILYEDDPGGFAVFINTIA